MIEHLLFACCLEDAHHDAAEEGFAGAGAYLFDWNEVRVTSISELAEVMACLPIRAAANRVKRVLHAVFETTFNFDLEDLRKKNLGPTVNWLEKLDGTTPFTVAYAVQAALGGHAIPVDRGTMAALRALDLVAEKDAATGAVPGLERAVAKAKGVEFGSLLHELGADHPANPYSAMIRDILLQIHPESRPAAQAAVGTLAAEGARAAGGNASQGSEGRRNKPPRPRNPRRKRSTRPPKPRVPSGRPSRLKRKRRRRKSAAAEKTLPHAAASKKRPASEGLASESRGKERRMKSK